MGFRFRRSIRILPGVRVNLGKRGASVSVGVRGAHVTVGPTGVRQTVGLPGTGMSYTTHRPWHSGGAPTPGAGASPTMHSPPSGLAKAIAIGALLVMCAAMALTVIIASFAQP